MYKRLSRIVVCTLTQKIIHHYVPLKKRKICVFSFFSKSNTILSSFWQGGNKYVYDNTILVWNGNNNCMYIKCMNYTYVTLGHCLSTLTLMFIVVYAMLYLNRFTMMMIYYYLLYTTILLHETKIVVTKSLYL